MTIRVVQVSRRPPWPLWAVLIVIFWLSVGGATLLLSDHLDRPVRLCLVKRLTGVPCPTCGFTRGALSLLRGRIIRAWLYNPLLFTAFGLLFIDTASRVLLARSVRISLTDRERRIAWIVVFVLFLANWGYVIKYVG